MRLKIRLRPAIKGWQTIPVNYAYPISSWVYHIIAGGDTAFAAFLHEKGYGNGHKAFKFFTFSMLDLTGCPYRMNKDRLALGEGEISLTLSFLVPEAVEHFVLGLFRDQELVLGDRFSQARFTVVAVESAQEHVVERTMTYKALSPLVVSEHIEGRNAAKYCHPEEYGYGQLLLNNLTSKYIAALASGLVASELAARAMPVELEHNFKLLTTPRKKGITIKEGTPQQTKLIGYQFDFTITLPEILHRMGYAAGFGEKNSLGFGCCEVKGRG
jgi:CRISPR-associated endoribonuclease Cas6